MDIILFRTLTEKSVLWFGKCINCTVESILIKDKSYIRWIYYNVEGVSFTEDVLKQAGVIIEEDGKVLYDSRIKKPGKNPQLGEEIDKKCLKTYIARQGNYAGAIAKNRKISVGRAKLTALFVREKTMYSKKILQRFNQGHKKEK